MAVYVDNMRAYYGRMIMCHMIADTDEELHEMADKIGLKREWHQSPNTYRSHYDISISKRALAVLEGAVEINMQQLGAIMKQKRESLENKSENS